MKYSRKPQIVEAEQVDLADPPQMARLLISVYDTPLGYRGSVVIGGIGVLIKTGDWLVQPVGAGNPMKKVMEDVEFQSTYAPVQVPSEVEFSPSVYQALRDARSDPKVQEEIRKIEDADRG